jgi:hypothetical protein
MRIQNVEETYLISYAQTNIGIMFEIGKWTNSSWFKFIFIKH